MKVLERSAERFVQDMYENARSRLRVGWKLGDEFRTKVFLNAPATPPVAPHDSGSPLPKVSYSTFLDKHVCR